MSADGNIRITIEVDNKEIKITSKDLEEMEKAARGAGKGAGEAGKGIDDAGKKSGGASGRVKDFVKSLSLVEIGKKVFSELAASLDSAINRFDTLNKYPKVLKALGVSAEDSQKSMAKLSDGIEGLPTTLDDIVASTQRFYMSLGDLDEATDSAIGLNNAFLASGSSAADASRGTEQYIQMLNNGKPDLQSWKTLQETMPVGLQKTAEAMGYTGKTAQRDLYKALQSGEKTFDEFNTQIIKLGTGTGELAKLARVNSEGIATSLGNLKNAASKGIANIIQSFDNLSKAVTGKSIAENIDGMKVAVNAAFNAMSGVIEKTTPVFKVFDAVIKATVSTVKTLSPAIAGAMAAYAAYEAITKASAAIKKSNDILKTATSAQKALTVVKKIDKTETAAQNGQITLATAAFGVLTGKIKLHTVATKASTAASAAFKAAQKALSGPIGGVTLAIGAAVTAAIALVKWFNRTTEDGKKFGKEIETLSGTTGELTESVNNNSITYERSQGKIDGYAESNKQLIDDIVELSEKENKSSADKKLLKNNIDQLNTSVEGLNLQYGEESDALTMTSEQMKNKVDLMKEQDKLTASQERLKELDEQQIDIQSQLKVIDEERNKITADGNLTKKETKKHLEELDKQEKALVESKKLAGEEHKKVDQEVKDSSAAVAAAAEQDTGKQIVLYDTLSDSQKASVDKMKTSWEDYKTKATDMFDTLSEKQTISVQDMTKNLETNQKVIGDWSDNIAKLAERGVDDGLLETLRAAGPSSAGHVKAMVDSSDVELQKLSDAFANGGEVATDALSKSLGIENSGVLDAVGGLVTGTETALRDELKSADFPGVGSEVPKGIANGIDKGAKDAQRSSKAMADKTTEAAKTALKVHSPSVVFRDMGVNVDAGLAQGIDSGASRVVAAIRRMMNEVKRESQINFNDITRGYDSSVRKIEQSLNRLPGAIGKAMSTMYSQLRAGTSKQQTLMRQHSNELTRPYDNLNSRLTNISRSAMNTMYGQLHAGASKQQTLMRQHSTELTKPFNNLNSRFNSIGANAMYGLNAGLNSKRGMVMATARSIANNVASTMQRALRIHSPSKVMEMDVGRYIPEGLAKGIRNNAKAAYAEMNKMAQNLNIRPEQALGASRMVYSGADTGRPIARAASTAGSTSNDYSSLITGNTFYIREDKDVERIAQELEKLKRRKYRGAGMMPT